MDKSNDYKNQFVRDLAWVIGSPPLFTNEFNNLFFEQEFFHCELNKLLPHLENLDKNPQNLREHIKNGNTHLLGKYFESLVEYWITNSKDKKLLAHNLQVFKGRNTIGEFDFIYRDLSKNIIYHLECAGKFYISQNNISDHYNFIGPNAIDNLEKKLNKTISEQAWLSRTNEGKDTLLIEDIIEEIVPKFFFKGYLFYYTDLFFSNSFEIPKYSNPNHPKGWWIYAKDIDYFLSQKNSKWIVVERANWISKVILFDDSSILSNRELANKLKNYFSINIYPLLISELKENNYNYFEEVSRGFVVNNNWPKINL